MDPVPIMVTHSLSIELLLSILLTLVCISAFFSCSETGMMAVNRYRLHHLAKTNPKAKRVLKLLAQPDRLLAVILIGNNFTNIAASAIATLVGVRLFGELGVLIATFMLTIVILIVAEITPKTLAALHAQTVAMAASKPLSILIEIMYPIVWISSLISNGLLRLVGVSHPKRRSDSLSLDELRTAVTETGSLISTQYKKMLTGLLDLDRFSVEDIMIPRAEVIGIDLSADLDVIAGQLRYAQNTFLPVFRENLDRVEGILHMRELGRSLVDQPLSKKLIVSLCHQPTFVFEGTSLQTQLLCFQEKKQRIGLVVDEYGEILGLVTLVDILEEIVGEFTTSLSTLSRDVAPQKDGSYLINGSTNIRSLNRALGWELPTDGAKTISGAIIEKLEMIPVPAMCVLLHGYPIEILRVEDNRVKTCRISKRLVNAAET